MNKQVLSPACWIEMDGAVIVYLLEPLLTTTQNNFKNFKNNFPTTVITTQNPKTLVRYCQPYGDS